MSEKIVLNLSAPTRWWKILRRFEAQLGFNGHRSVSRVNWPALLGRCRRLRPIGTLSELSVNLFMGFSPHPRPVVHKHAKKARRQHLFVYLAYASRDLGDVIGRKSALRVRATRLESKIVIADAIPKGQQKTYLLTLVSQTRNLPIDSHAEGTFFVFPFGFIEIFCRVFAFFCLPETVSDGLDDRLKGTLWVQYHPKGIYFQASHGCRQ